MDEIAHLPALVQGQLWRALEAAVAVRHRGEMFLWAQGQLQALIPHGIMVCLVLNAEHQVVHIDCLQGVPLETHALDALLHRESGLVVRLQRHCQHSDQHALVLPPPSGAASLAMVPPTLAAEWEQMGLGPAVFQGTGPLADGSATFFALLCMPHAASSTQQHVLQVVLPQLHLALLRAQRFGSTSAPTDAVAELDLSERQLEIIHWVKLGKTNHEISLILSISELTVKNHLQKLFKKLNVHNRTQAVARIMSFRLE